MFKVLNAYPNLPLRDRPAVHAALAQVFRYITCVSCIPNHLNESCTTIVAMITSTTDDYTYAM